MTFVDFSYLLSDTNVRSTKSDIELFYAAMKQLTLALVGSKSSDKPLTVESRQHAIRLHSHVTAEGRTTSQSEDELIQRERLEVTADQSVISLIACCSSKYCV